MNTSYIVEQLLIIIIIIIIIYIYKYIYVNIIYVVFYVVIRLRYENNDYKQLQSPNNLIVYE